MKKIILIYGAIGGTVAIGGIMLGLAMAESQDSAAASQWFGYLIMLIALSTIFMGVKRYRDQEAGGVITFGKGLLTGLGIAAIAGVAYVTIWEIYLAATDHQFIQQYTQSIIEAREAEGMTASELDAVKADMATMREQYGNPLFRVPMTFLEIVPVGLLVAFISAGLLRKSTFMPATGP